MSRENLSFPSYDYEALALEYVKLHITSEITPEVIAQIYFDASKRIHDELRRLPRSRRGESSQSSIRTISSGLSMD